MPIYSYRAKEGPSKVVTGTIDADNVDRAVALIIQKGLSPVDVQIFTGKNQSSARLDFNLKNFSWLRRVSQTDVATFTRQMSDMIEASVPILRVLQVVTNQTENLHLKEIVQRIYLAVKDGAALSTALAEHPKLFSSLYVNMVRTGEVSGQLELVFNRLAGYLEKENETRGKVFSSLAYPTFIFVIGIISVFVLVTFFIPRITVMFEDMDQQLPLPTIMLINLSKFFAQYWWLILILVGGGISYFVRFINSDNGRRWLHLSLLKLPLVGKMIQLVEIGRFARTMGTLIESGVVITTALNAVWATFDNVILREEVKKISDAVNNGSSIRDALRSTTFFPEMAINMISVGEETGRLDKGLYKIADTYERQAEETMKVVVALLGPMALVFIVGIVLFVVVAMLLPIFEMNLLVK